MAVVREKAKEVVTSMDIELAVANHFNPRMNLIVPNVFWGLGFKHELDVAVMTPSGYLTEIEIKVSRQDLKRDSLKLHGHVSQRIRRHFFAIPQSLKELCLEVARPEWGILVFGGGSLETIRHAKINKQAIPLSATESQKLYELAAMRIWTLKRALCDRINKQKLNTPPETEDRP